METFLFLVTYITNLAGFYIIKSNRRIGKEKKSVYDVLNAYLENGLKIMKLANMMIHRLMYSVAQDGTIGFVQTVSYYQS